MTRAPPWTLIFHVVWFAVYCIVYSYSKISFTILIEFWSNTFVLFTVVFALVSCDSVVSSCQWSVRVSTHPYIIVSIRSLANYR